MDDSVVFDVTFHTSCYAWCIGFKDPASETDHAYAWGESLNEAYDDLVRFLGYDPRHP